MKSKFQYDLDYFELLFFNVIEYINKNKFLPRLIFKNC